MSTVSHKRYIVHPHRFNLWLAIVAMIMMFAAFTSAYIVKKGDANNWLLIELPQLFTYSTITILISSLFMHAAYISFKRNKIYLYRIFICFTFILGSAFLIFQVNGWQRLAESGIILSGNPAGSFIYVISGAHFVHVVGGVIALLIFSIKSFTAYKTPVDTLLLNINTDKQVGVELMATYWHFVDILWIYLFIFFQSN
ncbi:MAG: cytochrome c oxidase subunit 3 [Fimbriimonadaceae bacterium]|nr:cytochrome c oxidase subunit 3 [Chitinophagales bacterium]